MSEGQLIALVEGRKKQWLQKKSSCKFSANSGVYLDTLEEKSTEAEFEVTEEGMKKKANYELRFS